MPTVFIGALHRATGLTLKLYDPLWSSNYGLWSKTIDRDIGSWQHDVNAFGGFGNASFTFNCRDDDIDEWLAHGLGRHVMGYNRALSVCYEGYVNTVRVNFGAISATVGPLMDIANRVSVVYTPIIDVGTDPPTKGTATETPIVDDDDSQGKYGIIEKIVSGGELIDDGTVDEAEEVRDLFLMESKYPYTDEAISLGDAGSPPSITVECGGYMDWLEAYAYNKSSILTTTVSDKIKAVIRADPNDLFPTTFANVATNMQLTKEGEDENRFAATIIKELVQLGDGTDTRWLFGIYEDREPFFSAIPLIPKYKHSIRHGLSSVETVFGQKVDPWDVRPGQWMYFPDFPRLGAFSVEPAFSYTVSDMRLDPRFLFIESVKYSAPQSVSITGSRVGKLSQRMAQLGIGGRS